MADLHTTPLLKTEIFLVTKAGRRVLAIVRILANFKSRCLWVPPLIFQQVLLVRRKIFLVVQRIPIRHQQTILVPLKTVEVLAMTVGLGGFGAALHTEIGLGGEISRATDAILGGTLRMRGIKPA